VASLWSQSLAVGIAAVDDQHRELFRRVDSLLEATVDGNSAEATRMLGFLAEYVEFHFAAEEALMRDHRYPGLEAHLAEHMYLRNQVMLVEEEYRRSGPVPALVSRMQHLLADWLRTHVGISDSAMARFMRRARGL